MNPLAWAQLAATIIVGSGGLGVVVALLKVRPERERIYADATKQVVASSLELLHPLEARADRLQRKVDDLEALVASLSRTLEEERRASRREIDRLTDERDDARKEAASLRKPEGAA